MKIDFDQEDLDNFKMPKFAPRGQPVMLPNGNMLIPKTLQIGEIESMAMVEVEKDTAEFRQWLPLAPIVKKGRKPRQKDDV